MSTAEYLYFIYFLPLVLAYWWGYSRRSKSLTFIPKIPLTDQDRLNCSIFERCKTVHSAALIEATQKTFFRQVEYGNVIYDVTLQKTNYGVWDWITIKKYEPPVLTHKFDNYNF
ncbi:hypothetical protein DRW42_24530 [Pedobacter miscanthi]|uniref:Uncharacterized protein n=1 Tax=Pedobacter miscanthi TaxID=2259170 RepID=A0A366KMR8_9SPHI|nr:hypothetical protein DRW42_24530 [Pedobacter miscanthi]